VNVLDENIVATQRQLLRSWKIHFRSIGGEVGRAGMKDRDEIIPLLHTLRRPTFFTRDHDFYKADLRHRGYCLVFLDVAFAKLLSLSAVSCGTLPFARRHSAWVEWPASITAE
jgi:hypothetical protein